MGFFRAGGPSGSRGRYSLPPMRLQLLIPEKHVVLGLEPGDKWETIGRLTGHLAGVGAFPREAVAPFNEAVQMRERSMSTGMERGIAIPHAAVDGLEQVVAALAVFPEGRGIEFGSIDASPSWLVVLLLIPRAQKLAHIRTLADLARHLGNEDVRRALRGARTAGDAWQALG
jgi:mannitol/fructose-specific phosphotransferase system IIA component (Ntr-type)